MYGEDDNEGEVIVHLHRPCKRRHSTPLHFLECYLLKPRKCMCLCTRRIFQTRLLPFFHDANTGGDASGSLAARKAYLHMTLHTAIGGKGIRRVLFSWNDVLLAWMWQQNMNMKIWKEQLSQRGLWYLSGLDIMCLLVCLLTVYYVSGLYRMCGLLLNLMHIVSFFFTCRIVLWI